MYIPAQFYQPDSLAASSNSDTIGTNIATGSVYILVIVLLSSPWKLYATPVMTAESTKNARKSWTQRHAKFRSLPRENYFGLRESKCSMFSASGLRTLSNFQRND